MRDDIIQCEWEHFARGVLHPDSPPDQRREMRRAFFAGAASMLAICSGLGESSVSVHAGVEAFEAMYEESRRFAASVARGEA